MNGNAFRAVNHFLPVLDVEDFPGYSPDLMKQYYDPGADKLAMLKTAAEMGMLDDRLYVNFLFSERGKSAYRALFRVLLELPEGRSVLWHCTDGKDRTGVASMLILAALGADRRTILEDYLLTNREACNRSHEPGARTADARTARAGAVRLRRGHRAFYVQRVGRHGRTLWFPGGVSFAGAWPWGG